MKFQDRKIRNVARQVERERIRYSNFAKNLQETYLKGEILAEGVSGIPIFHHAPIISYYAAIAKLIHPESSVLELGAGTGRHTGVLLDCGAKVTALDISEESLQFLELRTVKKLNTICASMESIPLPNSSFDFIVCAGSLSYADFELTWSEITRVLKPGGSLILLDTLNHNPIYRLNRFFQFLMGNRTFLTLVRMPKMSQIRRISPEFSNSRLSTFGEFLWIRILLKPLLGSRFANEFVTSIEARRSTSKYGFKFLLVAENFRGQL